MKNFTDKEILTIRTLLKQDKKRLLDTLSDKRVPQIDKNINMMFIKDIDSIIRKTNPGY